MEVKASDRSPKASDLAPLVIGMSDAHVKRITTAATKMGAAFACSRIGTAVFASLTLPNKNPSCKHNKCRQVAKVMPFFNIGHCAFLTLRSTQCQHLLWQAKDCRLLPNLEAV